MPVQLTAAQVQALAPDAASVAAGKKLAKPNLWKNLAHSAGALWGECQGSALYQTQVALSDLAAKCSCPSRKFPCKHALGLLLLAVDAPAAVPEGAEPEWVQSWLQKRGAAQEKKAARAQAAADKPVDAVAQAKRSEKRHENILAGLDQLDAWLNDLVRQGLARAQAETFAFWDAQARRLVDAQAPGLATRVRAMGGRGGDGEAWAERVLDQLGQLALISHAYRRLDQLDAGLAADVRRLVGLTLDKSEVLAHGDAAEDEWHVLTCQVEEDERVRTQRAWLRGASTRRTALVLQFAVANGRFEEALAAGMKLRARLSFWPSAAPQRALIAERLSQAEVLGSAPEGASVAQALDEFAGVLASSPWVSASLIVLAGVVPHGGEPLALADGTGAALPLARGDHDVLLALSGGHPITVAGEWNGYAFTPRTVWAEGRMVALGDAA